MAARSGVYSTATNSARSPGWSEVRAHEHGGDHIDERCRWRDRPRERFGGASALGVDDSFLRLFSCNYC